MEAWPIKGTYWLAELDDAPLSGTMPTDRLKLYILLYERPQQPQNSDNTPGDKPMEEPGSEHVGAFSSINMDVELPEEQPATLKPARNFDIIIPTKRRPGQPRRNATP